MIQRHARLLNFLNYTANLFIYLFITSTITISIDMCRINQTTVGPSYVSSLKSVLKTTEVDPRVPGNRVEFPFPQASSPPRKVRFHEFSFQVSVQSEIYSVCIEKLSSQDSKLRKLRVETF